jgi:hypothetical protein
LIAKIEQSGICENAYPNADFKGLTEAGKYHARYNDLLLNLHCLSVMVFSISATVVLDFSVGCFSQKSSGTE